jgi:hypothetical protein
MIPRPGHGLVDDTLRYKYMAAIGPMSHTWRGYRDLCKMQDSSLELSSN